MVFFLLDFAFISQRDRKKFNKICDEYYLSSLDFIEYILKKGYTPSSYEYAKLQTALNAVSTETDPQFLDFYSKIKAHLKL